MTSELFLRDQRTFSVVLRAARAQLARLSALNIVPPPLGLYGQSLLHVSEDYTQS